MRTDITLLTGTNLEERRIWAELANQGARDPHGHPAYVELFSQPGETPLALHIQNTDSEWLLPFIQRPLPALLGIEGYDATSAYGFGGPFLVAGCTDVLSILQDTADWFLQAGYVSTFLRLGYKSSMQLEYRPVPDWIRRSSEIVIIDRLNEPEARWIGYEHKVRKNVKKALRNGCTVSYGTDNAHWHEFADIYASTMERRNAANRYHFSSDFFEQIARDLQGSYFIILVNDRAGQAVSAELILKGRDSAYSFLGGTTESAFPMAPNDLLKHEASRILGEMGVASYVLGGGYGPDDGIFRYKRSFSPKGIYPHRTVRLISNEDRYDAICHASTGGIDEFFPWYRSS